MSALTELDFIDIRYKLPRATWHIGKRYGPALSATLHYNGPPTALANLRKPTIDQEIAHFQAIAKGHIERIWGYTKQKKPIYGDGIMYPLAVGPSGRIYLMRDLDDIRWHCANESGNETSVGVHLPLGGNQDATEVQWESVTRVLDGLIEVYDLGGRSRKAVVGHREWTRDDGKAQSACPGPLLMRRLIGWREAKTIMRFCTTIDANVRQGPGIDFDKAWIKFIPANRIITCDELKPGTTHSGTNQWAHMLSGDGFVHMSCLAPVS